MQCGDLSESCEQTDQLFIADLPSLAAASLKYALSTSRFGWICVVTFMAGRNAVVLLAFAALAWSLILVSTGVVADEQDAWAALVNGGYVALVRHGSAPIRLLRPGCAQLVIQNLWAGLDWWQGASDRPDARRQS
jgi:hypothetical protein